MWTTIEHLSCYGFTIGYVGLFALLLYSEYLKVIYSCITIYVKKERENEKKNKYIKDGAAVPSTTGTY